MDTDTKQILIDRRDALEKELKDFIMTAEKQVSAFQGAISVLNELILKAEESKSP